MPSIPVLGGPSSTSASRAARTRRSKQRQASDAAAAKATAEESRRNAPLELPRLDDFSVEQNSARFIRRSRWVSVDIGAFPVRA